MPFTGLMLILALKQKTKTSVLYLYTVVECCVFVACKVKGIPL